MAVKAGRQGELPRGSVTLATSSTYALLCRALQLCKTAQYELVQHCLRMLARCHDCNGTISCHLCTWCSGSTLYIEPEPVVALNNAEARLAAAKEEEEAAILLALSCQVY